MIGKGSAAGKPSDSRLVEAVRLLLVRLHHKASSSAKARRWGLVLEDYGRIRDLVVHNPLVRRRTGLQLFDLSQKTVSAWWVEPEIFTNNCRQKLDDF